MPCRYAISSGHGYISCNLGGYCPYQYWCNKDRCYKSTAASSKCKKYEKADETDKK